MDSSSFLASARLDELLSMLNGWEIAGYIAVIGVIAGVFGEVIHDFTAWFKSFLWWEAKGNRASALLLVIALGAELVIAIRVNAINGEIVAGLRFDAATLRAALKKEHEQFAARHLNAAKRTCLVNHLTGFKTPIIFAYTPPTRDEEAFIFGEEFWHVFSDAKLKFEYERAAGPAFNGIDIGDRTDMGGPNPEDTEFATILRDCGVVPRWIDWRQCFLALNGKWSLQQKPPQAILFMISKKLPVAP